MANQATAGNTTSQTAFGFVAGPFGPTPHLPPFSVAAGTGFLAVEPVLDDGVSTFALGTPGGGPNNILTPDNARDNSQAKLATGPLHPLSFEGG